MARPRGGGERGGLFGGGEERGVGGAEVVIGVSGGGRGVFGGFEIGDVFQEEGSGRRWGGGVVVVF